MGNQRMNQAHMKVNKNEFLKHAAVRANMSVAEMKGAFRALMDEAVAVLCSGKDLSLTGFGTFGLKTHKGHPVRFNAGDGKVRDYVVMKFVPSDVLMSRIRKRCDAELQPDDDGEEEVCDGTA